MDYRPRRDDEELAYMVGGHWFEVLSDTQYLDGEWRFLTKRDGETVEMHVMFENIQATLWPVDQ